MEIHLTGSAAIANIGVGGSRKGSKGNAVRVHVHARNAAAAPATVSGESSTGVATGNIDVPGKVVEGSDPRARRSAASNGHARARRAGCPGVNVRSPVVSRSLPEGEGGSETAKIAVTGTFSPFGAWRVACQHHRPLSRPHSRISFPPGLNIGVRGSGASRDKSRRRSNGTARRTGGERSGGASPDQCRGATSEAA
jgi:hypothetical protein